MLEYENQMFLDALQEDGLTITAKGLGLETVFTNILRVYSDPGNLVIVLGTLDYDEKYFLDKLTNMGVKVFPKVVTSQFSSNERKILYLEGGVLFISGRIFVVDLLKDRVPLNLVTGMLVYRAHNILNSYQEAFALRIYRQKNKTGFIKGFSNSALAFNINTTQVDRVMKTLFVKKLYLWPRFHSLVKSSLSHCSPKVIELHVKLTDKMLKIQTSLLDIMNFIIKELKGRNKSLELEELTIENAIAKKFHKQLQNQLDPIWHQLGSSTKQFIADLKLLGHYLTRLTQDNAIAFYAMINHLRSKNYIEKNPGWLVLDAVDDLFKEAKSRVYESENEVNPEHCPKWAALKEVLNEIRVELNQKEVSENTKKVLILVSDSKMASQLKNYLTIGPTKYFKDEAKFRLSKTTMQIKTNGKEKKNVNILKNDGEDKDAEENEYCYDQDSYLLSLSQKYVENAEDEKCCNDNFQECSLMTDSNIEMATQPIVLLQSFKKTGDSMALQRTLYESHPSYVIMYGADISAIRQLEVFQNNNPSISLKVFFLVYVESVEEQGYLTSLRREKEAFDKLINMKMKMVIPTDQDGKTVIEIEEELDNLNSRKGNQDTKNEIHKVIVDVREFRSELPGLLHKRGIEIEPVTLIIGDYILTPDICIERKSINDLIMSLNSGRLYNQAVSLTRYYSKPMILIEFDQNKSFCLKGNYYLSNDITSFDITKKLQLLTMHFPKLKLVWSPNPQSTAQLFEELKEGKTQPDSIKAAQFGLEEDTNSINNPSDIYNIKIHDFVAKLPGVNSKNLRAILNEGGSIDKLAQLSLKELIDLTGTKINGTILFKALNEKYESEQVPTAVMSKAVSKIRNKGLFSSKKS